MTRRQKTTILTVIGVADLACFVFANVGCGEIWNGLGVFGILLFLALFEFL